MKRYRAELHVHTVLSPCAEIEMLPPLIIEEALQRQIDILAITDHNATGNIHSVMKAADGTGITVLPGMEVQSREEVHILIIFDTLEQICEWQEYINLHLPVLKNDPSYFGDQLLVDETGNFLGREERLLITSTDLSIEEIATEASRQGGLVIPAHVDRPGFGIFANLGFIPPMFPIDAVEISRHIHVEEAQEKFPQLRVYPMIKSGDVHQLDDFLGANIFQMESPTIRSIRDALRMKNGCTHQIVSTRTIG